MKKVNYESGAAGGEGSGGSGKGCCMYCEKDYGTCIHAIASTDINKQGWINETNPNKSVEDVRATPTPDLTPSPLQHDSKETIWWDFEYFKNIGPLYDDDGNNVDGKVKNFISKIIARDRKKMIEEIEVMGAVTKEALFVDGPDWEEYKHITTVDPNLKLTVTYSEGEEKE